MPTRYAQTGWRHNDEKLQREFERISRGTDNSIKKAVQDTVNDTLGPEGLVKQKIRQVSHNDITKVQDVTMLDFQDVVSEGVVIPGFYEVYGSQEYGKVKTFARMPIKTGIIHINTLPDRSYPYNQRDWWKRLDSDIRPDTPYNWYGWAVYNFIDHGWDLQDPNDFILHLVDVDETELLSVEDELDIPSVYSWVDDVLSDEDMLDEAKVLLAIKDYYNLIYGAFTPKKDRLLVDGLNIEEMVLDGEGNQVLVNKNIVLLRGVHKPDLPSTYNARYEGRLDYLDEAERKVRTNLKFRYVLLKGS